MHDNVKQAGNIWEEQNSIKKIPPSVCAGSLWVQPLLDWWPQFPSVPVPSSPCHRV